MPHKAERERFRRLMIELVSEHECSTQNESAEQQHCGMQLCAAAVCRLVKLGIVTVCSSFVYVESDV